jgi:uncharacterized protein HemX
MPSRRSLLVTLALALLAGLAGAMIALGLQRAPDQTALHDRLHEQLDLSAAQERSFEAEEADFAARKRAFTQRIGAENNALAVAIRTTGRYGPEVQRAIDRIHDVLGDHQKETVAHVFRMRRKLAPAQTERFDAIVGEALSAQPAPDDAQ